jgi:hypothetical protein
MGLQFLPSVPEVGQLVRLNTKNGGVEATVVARRIVGASKEKNDQFIFLSDGSNARLTADPESEKEFWAWNVPGKPSSIGAILETVE